MRNETDYRSPLTFFRLNFCRWLLASIFIAGGQLALSQYPLLPFPQAYRSPSGDAGQILLDGIVTNVTLFHGSSDYEADWSVYIRLSNEVKNSLKRYLEERDYAVGYQFNEEYGEIMVIDKFLNLGIDQRFYASDFTGPLKLQKPGSTHPAWGLAVEATNDQGREITHLDQSRLNGGRVYLQGPFVNDKEHQIAGLIMRVEIHPIDGMAFAMDEDGSVYSVKYGDPAWAKSYVRWRVAFFANSSYHRIDGESYVKKERTTRFYLDLPQDAYPAPTEHAVTTTVRQEQQKLWNGDLKVWYSGRGWKWLRHSVEVDPRDGRKKLRVTARMKKPDRLGGIIVVDYIVRTSPTPPAHK